MNLTGSSGLSGAARLLSVPPRLGRASGEPIIILAQSIRNQSGKVLGVLAAAMVLNSSDSMGNLYVGEMAQENSIPVISRSENVFIIPPDKVPVLNPVPEPEVNLLHDKAMAGFNGTGITTNAFGIEELSAIADVEKLDWFVVSRIPTAIAYADERLQILTFLVNGAVMLLVTVLFIAIALSFYFRPLNQASLAVREMATEQWKIERLPVKRDDEIGDLIVGFNNLVDMVNKRTTELEDLSRIDSLTGLNNIRHMNSLMDLKWLEYQRRKQIASVIMIDIDFFKKYNDTYGHQEGDVCLKNVAVAMKSCLHRPTDLMARYGGEEFIVFIEGGQNEACGIAEKIRLAVRSLYKQGTGPGSGRVYCGMGCLTIHHITCILRHPVISFRIFAN